MQNTPSGSLAALERSPWRREHWRKAFRIVLCYVVFGVLWILLSDRVVLWLLHDSELLTRAQMVKGWAFVLLSGALFYGLVSRAFRGVIESRNQLGNANRALRLISDSNQALLRSGNLDELVQSVCDIVVRHGGYRMAWVGLIDERGNKLVPVSSSGYDEGYTEKVNIDLDHPTRSRGPAGRALEHQQPVVCKDLVHDPAFEPWRQAALERGYTACAVLPLLHGAASVGVLAVYTSDGLVIDDAEEEYLTELAGDLAFGIATMKLRQSEKDYRDALAASEARYRHLVEDSRDIILSTDKGGNVTYASEAVKAYGYRQPDIVGHSMLDFVVPEDRIRVRGELKERMITGADFPTEFRAFDAERNTHWLELRGRTVYDENNTLIGLTGVLRDISDRKQMQQQLERATKDALFLLARAAEYRDEGTGEHVKRMGSYAALLARKMGLDGDAIAHAAPLHDVGKIGIPDRILLKPGQLDTDEWDVMKRHPLIAADILSDSEFETIQMAREIALTHHERWDGSGYPHGLKGEDIPLAGRIAAVADVFDALTSSRPYRTQPMTVEQAFDCIVEGCGTMFDPEVVHHFLEARAEVLAVMG